MFQHRQPWHHPHCEGDLLLYHNPSFWWWAHESRWWSSRPSEESWSLWRRDLTNYFNLVNPQVHFEPTNHSSVEIPADRLKARTKLKVLTFYRSVQEKGWVGVKWRCSSRKEVWAPARSDLLPDDDLPQVAKNNILKGLKGPCGGEFGVQNSPDCV